MMLLSQQTFVTKDDLHFTWKLTSMLARHLAVLALEDQHELEKRQYVEDMGLAVGVPSQRYDASRAEQVQRLGTEASATCETISAERIREFRDMAPVREFMAYFHGRHL